MIQGINKFVFAALLLSTTAALQACASRPQIVTPTPPVAAPKAVMPIIPIPAPNEFTVFYDSDPPGAILYGNSTDSKVGETPFWANYELTENDRKHGFIFIPPTRVVWLSGATATNHPGVVFALKDGFKKTYIFSRPHVKGSEDDYAYGLKRLMHRYTYGEDGSKPDPGL